MKLASGGHSLPTQTQKPAPPCCCQTPQLKSAVSVIAKNQKFGLLPLDFDGRADSIYHPFDAAGKRHMEYVAQRGPYDDLPLDEILVDFRVHYPRWIADLALAQPAQAQGQADFMADVQAEVDRGASQTQTSTPTSTPTSTSTPAAPAL